MLNMYMAQSCDSHAQKTCPDDSYLWKLKVKLMLHRSSLYVVFSHLDVVRVLL